MKYSELLEKIIKKERELALAPLEAKLKLRDELILLEEQLEKTIKNEKDSNRKQQASFTKRYNMKTLKIDFCSDLHVDFWIKELSACKKLDDQVTNFVENTLKPQDGDVLILAGDLGHYYIQDTKVLLELKKHYQRIILVRGNHDLYLVSKNQQEKYNFNSFERVQEMKAFCEVSEIDYLDGTQISIDGFNIGGVGMWYNTPTWKEIDLWLRVMNDSNLIMEGSATHKINYGYGGVQKITSFKSQEYYYSEVEKLKSLKDIDVLVTHVSPIIIPDEYLFHGYIGDEANIFYNSDNIETVNELNPDLVIFGHTHNSHHFTINGIEYVCNPLGYKHEGKNNPIRQIEIFKE